MCIRDSLKPAQRADQFKGRARAAQGGEGVAVEHRIHDGTFGQFGAGLMMIGDHDFKPQLARQRHLLNRGDAAVHGDEQIGLFADFAHCIHVQAISLVMARRNIGIHLEAHGAQVHGENRGGAHAVHVIIAVDRNPKPFLQRLMNDIHRLVHIV